MIAEIPLWHGNIQTQPTQCIKDWKNSSFKIMLKINATKTSHCYTASLVLLDWKWIEPNQCIFPHQTTMRDYIADQLGCYPPLLLTCVTLLQMYIFCEIFPLVLTLVVSVSLLIQFSYYGIIFPRSLVPSAPGTNRRICFQIRLQRDHTWITSQRKWKINNARNQILNNSNIP